MKLFCSQILLVLLLAPIVFGAPHIPAPPQDRPILLEGATVYPISAKPIPNGKILFSKGKIVAVAGADSELEVPAETKRISVRGKEIYPGLIAANSVLGLVEINAVRSTRDMIEPGGLNPNARAEVAVNPDSELIPVARANGILSALSVPQSRGGLISGTSALVALDGWTWEDMTIRAPVGMHLFWPDVPTPGSDKKRFEAAEKQLVKQIKKLDDFFAQAKAWSDDPNREKKTDLRLAAMAPVLKGETAMFIHADRLKEIMAALEFTGRWKLRTVLVGGRDAWRIAPMLKEKNVAVILSPVQELPLRRGEPYDTSFTTPLKLHEAGVPFCIANEGSSFQAAHERNLPYQAAQAAAYGLPVDEALKSVTLYPARILGAEDKLGSLEPGKQATLIVCDNTPLEITSHVEMAFIDGREIDLQSRHTRLYKKYKAKYRN